MQSTFSVARREFAAFFNSPMAYIVLGVFLLVTGWMFFSTLFLAGQASMRGFFSLTPFMFVFLAPAITMRLVAEERKSGTLELLLTYPINDWEVVLGKFIAALAMVFVGLVFTFPYAVSVSMLVAPGISFDWGPVVGGYVGLLLMAASFIALGLWASSLTRNQIVGFILGSLLCFAFWAVDKFAMVLPEGASAVLQYLSVDYHFDNISRGVLDTRDILFYITLSAVGLLLTSRSLASTRN